MVCASLEKVRSYLKNGNKVSKPEILIQKMTIVQLHRESSTTEESLDENPIQKRIERKIGTSDISPTIE